MRSSIAARSPIVKSLDTTSPENHVCGSSTSPLAHDFRQCFSTKTSSSCSTIEHPAPPAIILTNLYPTYSMESSTAISAKSSFRSMVRPSITNTLKANAISPSVYLLMASLFSTRETCLCGQSFSSTSISPPTSVTTSFTYCVME